MKHEIVTTFAGPWAVGPELLTLDVGDWKASRPVVNRVKCCHCGTCYLFCPTGCIEDRETFLEANLTFCKGCGICAKECPAWAITMIREEQER
jgi:2-oxoacid:acceptor oxidoreductase delta subunit (pyruvate/2-ketoisovalerate family)